MEQFRTGVAGMSSSALSLADGHEIDPNAVCIMNKLVHGIQAIVVDYVMICYLHTQKSTIAQAITHIASQLKITSPRKKCPSTAVWGFSEKGTCKVSKTSYTLDALQQFGFTSKSEPSSRLPIS